MRERSVSQVFVLIFSIAIAIAIDSVLDQMTAAPLRMARYFCTETSNQILSTLNTWTLAKAWLGNADMLTKKTMMMTDSA